MHQMRFLSSNQQHQSIEGIMLLKGKGKGVYSYLWKFHHTATECHLPYGITQCYLPPDTSEHTPPLPQPDRLVLDLPTI